MCVSLWTHEAIIHSLLSTSGKADISGRMKYSLGFIPSISAYAPQKGAQRLCCVHTFILVANQQVHKPQGTPSSAAATDTIGSTSRRLSRLSKVPYFITVFKVHIAQCVEATFMRLIYNIIQDKH